MSTIINTSDFKAGRLIKQTGNYKALIPNEINRQWSISNPKLEFLISKAHQHLGELNAFAQLVPNVDFFIKMHITKEATLSSKIEGTQTTVEEAFLKKQDIRPEERDDWEEVQNYIKAMNFGLEQLKTLPVSNRLIRLTHGMLLDGVRGQNKLPGTFRTSQNWIGGSNINNAVFIPPPHHEINALMGDLELFFHNDEIYVSDLVRAAISHYQFETIHPFLDGNGRIGRLLITLFLVSKGMLNKPALYLSDYFEKNRSEYYYHLTQVREKNKLDAWLQFFMEGVIQTSESSVTTFKKITFLREKLIIKIAALGRKHENAKVLLNFLFSQPVVNTQDVMKEVDVSMPTANALLNDFTKLNILKERTGYRRNRVYSFTEYLELF